MKDQWFYVRRVQTKLCHFVGFILLAGSMLSLLAPLANATPLPDLVSLVKDLKPVVVNISSTQNPVQSKQRKSPPNNFGSLPLDEFFRHFFEQMPQESLKTRSLGSGVIIDPEGYILTNNHVIADADNIQVRLPDEREFVAEVVGKDSKTDLALIRIKGAGILPAAQMGDSDKAEVGSWVVAIGNPFGLETTVTAGIISAKGRIIGSGPYDNFLQTDAAINPGNSGGPLFNLEGKVIGINTAIFSKTGGSMGIGFAIPANMAKSVLLQLKSQGHVTRGWLGVRIQAVTQELAQALGLQKRHGALVASVEVGSPAATAGIKTGDVIIQFDGREVDHMNELPTIVAQTPIGKKVPMDIVRAQKPLTLYTVIAEMKEKSTPTTLATEKGDVQSFGLTVRALNPAISEQLGLDDAVHGVVVTNVESGSNAAEAGIQIRDVIIEINHKEVQNVDDFRQALRGVKPGGTLLVLLLRDGDPRYLVVPVTGK